MTTLPIAGSRVDHRSAIIREATALLREGGPVAVTTRAVAARAGLQAPAIYRLFGDKEGLLEAVVETAMAQYAEEKDRFIDDFVDPVEGLRTVWRQHIDFGLANPGVYRLLDNATGAGTSTAITHGTTVLRARIDRMASAGLLTTSPDRAVGMVHAAGHGTVLALIERTPDDRDAGLADAVLDAILAAITPREPRGDTAPHRPAAHDLLASVVQFSTVVDVLPLSMTERGLLAEWIRRCITLIESPRTHDSTG